ncbi:MAG: hypothetical protein JWQ42_4435 [Edaphobacter sp.]|nr:hypothetical protein [Edaphobacter sp.]
MGPFRVLVPLAKYRLQITFFHAQPANGSGIIWVVILGRSPLQLMQQGVTMKAPDLLIVPFLLSNRIGR